VEKVFDVSKSLKIGQEVWVKALDVKDSKISLSMKDVDQTTGTLIEKVISVAFFSTN